MTKSNKRKRNQSANRNDVLSKPSTWRRQHGDFDPPSFDTDPDTGTVVVHHRAADTPGIMLLNGTLTPEVHECRGDVPEPVSWRALGDMPTSQLPRLPGRVTDALSEHNVDPRRKLTAAIDMLGGHASAAGSCAWHVLVCEWAMRRGWWCHPVVHLVQARGILTAGLSVLVANFGLPPRSRAA